jgi:putative ABC transport system ATP-binding protein
MGHPPRRLSIGERQRVAVARALANGPSLLLADEPTGNLDSVSEREILDLLARLRAERSFTLVVVTHSSEVSGTADREIRLRDGVLDRR